MESMMKVVVIMGATGTGKSKLSIDLSKQFPNVFEIINSDKIQLYKGLDITTNKLPLSDQHGIPHHLLGVFEQNHQNELSPFKFRTLAEGLISDITSRKKIPVLVGGSNSFVHALLVEDFNLAKNIFDDENEEGKDENYSYKLRYNCCFLWLDVSFMVLSQYLSNRVDDMLNAGMYEELSEFYKYQNKNNEKNKRFNMEDEENLTVLRKAIGVPEFKRYFKEQSKEAYEEAVRAMKDNTCRLAERQRWKIVHLMKKAGWELLRIDATEAFRALLRSTSSNSDLKMECNDLWETQVLKPCIYIVKQFLGEEEAWTN